MAFRQCAVLAMLIVATGLHQGAEAATHVVGGADGWTFQASDLEFYDNWAKDQTFRVGDILQFDYTGTTHDAAEVTAAQLAACDSSDPILQNATSGGSTVSISSTGSHAYLCTLTSHCGAGMKMTITVVGAGSGPNASPSPPSTESPSDAASLKALQYLSNAVLGCAFYSFVVALTL